MRPAYLMLAALALPCACTPDPPPAAPQTAARALVLEAIPVILPGRYVATHGAEVKGPATPWAQETADVLGVDLPALSAKLGASPVTAGRLPVTLMSPAHRTGEWTYARSDSARVHQLRPVKAGALPGRWLAVLAAAGPPDQQVIDVSSATWILALAPPDAPVATLQLGTRTPHETKGLWDGISTSLDVAEGKLSVEVEYSHTGGGGACEQKFTFVVRAETGSRLTLDRSDHQAAPCAQLGLP